MKWQPFSFFKRRKPIRRPAAQVRLGVEELESRLLLAVNVLTYDYDISNSGVNTNETQLTPANVSSGSFGQLYNTPVDGQIYAQPLVDNGVTIANGPYTNSGAAGVHNVVFVATENDSLYAIDTGNGAILWQRNFLDPNDPNDALPGASSVSAVPYQSATAATDISPTFGITGTPVIDPSTNIMYVVTATEEMVNGVPNYVQRLHAINIANGTDATTPYTIGDTTDGNDNNTTTYDNNTSIYVYGDGNGSVTDPYNGTGQPVDQFNAQQENQRAALSLVNGTLYVSWGAHGSTLPYFGWIAAWNVSNLVSDGFQLTGVLNTNPDSEANGVWQGGGALTFTPNGSAFFFTTAAGPLEQVTVGANGLPTDGDYDEAVVEATLNPSTTPQNQGQNGWGFQILDYFMPAEAVQLGTANMDMDSDVALLPSSAGIPGHPNLILAGNKSGRLFLLDANNLGGYNPTNQDVLNAVPTNQGNLDAPVYFNGVVSSPIYFDGQLYVVGAYNDPTKAFTINSDGTLTENSQTSATLGFEPSSPTISADGTANGILWLVDRANNELQAYNANNLSDELWNSGEGADALGSSTKFMPPVVANGMVFVGTANSLVVYGLTAPNAVSQAPTLSATALSGTSVNLSWQDPSQSPNVASAYVIEESTDGIHFTEVATAPQGATSLTLGGLTPGVPYSFRIYGINALGDSPYSNVATATPVATFNFSGGFVNSSNSLTYNGSAYINGNSAELTDGGDGEAGSVFTSTPVDIDAFQTQFTFQLSAGAGTGNGITFTIQNAGPNALGAANAGLGYGADPTTGLTGGIPQSVAIKFDLYGTFTFEGNDSTGLFTDGNAPSIPSTDLSNSGIDLHSGDVFQVNMAYNGTTLTVVITDTNTGASATQNYNINIPGMVGGDTAYVGFTGSTGDGTAAAQDILTWTFAPPAAQAPASPSNLQAAPASAGSIVLSWTNNSTNQTGYYLDRATDPGFTQNLVTQLLPGASNTFTDVDGYLTPGVTYYYRLRAINSAGSSANTAAVAVAIPPLPPPPSNAVITSATSNSVSLSWTDNAGPLAAGYQIYRSTNGGPFTLQAILPAGSTSWTDTNVSPATSYTYAIVAYNVTGSYGDAVVSGSTRSPSSPASNPVAAILNSVTAVLPSLIQLEMDAYLLVAYLNLASSGADVGPLASMLNARIESLWSAIASDPLVRTPLGLYALEQAFSQAQSSNKK